MTVLFRKITNKMIWNCRQHINGAAGEKIWDQDIPQLITRLQSCATPTPRVAAVAPAHVLPSGSLVAGTLSPTILAAAPGAYHTPTTFRWAPSSRVCAEWLCVPAP